MRDHAQLSTIIGQIIELIPKDYVYHDSFVASLKHMRNSLPYHAPELLGDDWRKLGATLIHFIGPSDGREWAQQIGAIVRGEQETSCP